MRTYNLGSKGSRRSDAFQFEVGAQLVVQYQSMKLFEALKNDRLQDHSYLVIMACGSPLQLLCVQHAASHWAALRSATSHELVHRTLYP